MANRQAGHLEDRLDDDRAVQARKSERGDGDDGISAFASACRTRMRAGEGPGASRSDVIWFSTSIRLLRDAGGTRPIARRA